MDHVHVGLGELPWILGWVVAVGVLFWFALRIPLQTKLPRWLDRIFGAGVIVAIIATLALANFALSRHHMYFDLTREKKFTPSRKALEVVSRLQRPVKLTYLYQSDDERGRRARDIVELMGRRNALLQVTTADPDRQPNLARRAGVKSYNTAVLEAGGRRVAVQTVDEAEIAIAIQRVLRERVVAVCFMEGHNEYPSDNYAFHTHVEGLAGHEHDHASSAVIRTSAHGIGRLRRALDNIGFETRKIMPARHGKIPADCAVLVNASPRTTYLPVESRAVETYLRQGGALLAMYDLGFVLEPGLAALVKKLGVTLPQAVVIDPKSHYATNPEMVAVTGYDKHAITRSVSLTFYPGMRPLVLSQPVAGVRTVPLIRSSDGSYTQAVLPAGRRMVIEPPAAASVAKASEPELRSHVLAVAIDGRLPGVDNRPFRAIIIGDGDFASNSFFPFMSNNDLALAMVRWLAREENETAIASRVRVPALILLTNRQMQTVFLFIEILLPLSIILLGGLIWWRRR
ncbi:MAG: GldG family protein [Hyphomicrobiaceae bacterium]